MRESASSSNLLFFLKLTHKHDVSVSVVIMEQTGSGINTANSAYWDSVRDGCKIVVWPEDKKKNE